MTTRIKIKNKNDFIKRIIMNGESYRGFSTRAGLSNSTIYPIINNGTNISSKTALKICNALDSDFEDLFEIQINREVVKVNG